MLENDDLTALSHWFPLIKAAGLPVPETIFVDMPEAAQQSIWDAFDGKETKSAEFDAFVAEIGAACQRLGLPSFLRTDHTSGKHGWARNCFVASLDALPSHIFGIAEYSEMAGLVGFPWSRWVVREFLPTKPFGVCPRYDDMPICKEFRFFVDDGRVRCFHPYWPLHALEQGGAPEGLDYEALCRADNEPELIALAEAAGVAVGGSWSIDLLETERGWCVTDMAEAHKSFHWEGCASTHNLPPQALMEQKS